MTHQELVTRLVKPGVDILASMTPEKASLGHLAMGIVGEAGELSDAIKRHCIYDRPLDMVNILEELGDIEFFLEAIRQQLNIKREDTLEGNITKLCIRYPFLSYNNQHAIERTDKQ